MRWLAEELTCKGSLYELMGYRFLTGVGGSFQMAGAQLCVSRPMRRPDTQPSYLSDISTPANRARSMAPIGMAFALGAMVGPGVRRCSRALSA